jgi:hypothetical protein
VYTDRFSTNSKHFGLRNELRNYSTTRILKLPQDKAFIREWL